jgi:hypothetical protein
MTPPRRHIGLRIGLIGLAAASGFGLSACADLGRATGVTPEPIDASSPVATQVSAATRTHYPRPSFRDVPPKPTDVRRPAGFRAAVAENDTAGAQLESWIAANPPEQPLDPAATEAYAAQERAKIPPGERIPQAPVGSEEYAARLRALATPPPPPK